MAKMRVQNFVVHGFSSIVCKRRLEKAILGLEGVTEVKTHTIKNTIRVCFNEDLCNTEKILSVIQKVGCFEAQTVADPWQSSSQLLPEDKQLKRRLVGSIVLTLLIALLALGPSYGLDLVSLADANMQFQLGLCIFVMALHYQCYYRGFKNFIRLTPEINSLIVLATVIAFGFSCFNLIHIPKDFLSVDLASNFTTYFGTVAGVLSLFSLGLFIENRARSKVVNSFSNLYELVPKTVLRRKDAGSGENSEFLYETEETSVEHIQVGDILVARSGSKIAADGYVIEGSGYFDECKLSGYLYLQHRIVGSKVIAGSSLKHGYVVYKVTAVGADTHLAQILNALDESNSRYSALSRFAERLSLFLVPFVMVCAGLTFYAWAGYGAPTSHALSYAISVLLIACPAAISLATPTSIMLASARAVKFGVMIRDPEAFENLSQMDLLVFDKAGIITRGNYRVAHLEVNPDSSSSTMELLHVVRLLEEPCKHVLSHSLIAYIEEVRARILSSSSSALRDKLMHLATNQEVTDWHFNEGLGVTAKIRGHQYFIGSSYYVIKILTHMRSKQDYLTRYENHGLTTLYLFDNKQILASFALYDEIHVDAPHVVRILDKLNVRSILVSGDSYKVVENVARNVNIDTFRARYLPQDRRELLSGLTRNDHFVGVVDSGIGDGIFENSKNGLVSGRLCDVHITLANNLDLRNANSDVVLMHNHLMDLVPAVLLSKLVLKNIRQNLILALSYNILALPLASGFFSGLGIVIHPILAMGCGALSCLGILFNALRLTNSPLRYKSDEGELIEIKEQYSVSSFLQSDEQKLKTKTEFNPNDANKANLAKSQSNVQSISFEDEVGMGMGFVKTNTEEQSSFVHALKSKDYVKAWKKIIQKDGHAQESKQKKVHACGVSEIQEVAYWYEPNGVASESEQYVNHLLPQDELKLSSQNTLNLLQADEAFAKTVDTPATKSTESITDAQDLASLSEQTDTQQDKAQSSSQLAFTVNTNAQYGANNEFDVTSNYQPKTTLEVDGIKNLVSEQVLGFNEANYQDKQALNMEHLAVATTSNDAEDVAHLVNDTAQADSPYQQKLESLQQDSKQLVQITIDPVLLKSNAVSFNEAHKQSVADKHDESDLMLSSVNDAVHLIYEESQCAHEQELDVANAQENVELSESATENTIESTDGNILSGAEPRYLKPSESISLSELNNWYQRSKNQDDSKKTSLEHLEGESPFMVTTTELTPVDEDIKPQDDEYEKSTIYASSELGFASSFYSITIKNNSGEIDKHTKLKRTIHRHKNGDELLLQGNNSFIQAQPAVDNSPKMVAEQILEEIDDSNLLDESRTMSDEDRLFVNDLVREVDSNIGLEEQKRSARDTTK